MSEPPAPPALPTRAPLWLRLLVLFVVLWLGARIVRSITDSLTAMTGAGHAGETLRQT